MTAAKKLRMTTVAAGGGGGGGIEYVGMGTAASVSGTTLSVALDAGHSTGDCLLVVVNVSGHKTITPPSGWVGWQIGGISGTDNTGGVWYRIADGSEASSEDWTFTSGNGVGVCYAFANVASVADCSANDLRAGFGNPNSYTGTLPTVDTGDWVFFYAGTSPARAMSAAPSGATLLSPGVSALDLGIDAANEGPVSSAPTIAAWTHGSSTLSVCGAVLLKL